MALWHNTFIDFFIIFCWNIPTYIMWLKFFKISLKDCFWKFFSCLSRIVFNQWNWNSFFRSDRTYPTCFCFKDLAESKLLSERILYRSLFCSEKAKFTVVRPLHSNGRIKSMIMNRNIIFEQKLRTGISFDLKLAWPR